MFINHRKYKKINFGVYLGILIFFIFLFNIIYFYAKGLQKLRLNLIKIIKKVNNSNICNNIIDFKNLKLIPRQKRKKTSLFIINNNPPLKDNSKKTIKKLRLKERTKVLNEQNINYIRVNKIKKSLKRKSKKLSWISNSNSKNILNDLSYEKNKGKKKRKIKYIKNMKKYDISENKIINLSEININKNDNNGKKNIEYIKFTQGEKRKSINEIDFNELLYSQALILDKRNFLKLFLSSFIVKINLIQIIFYPEEFTNFSITFNLFILSSFLEIFINSLLYTDEIVSNKYHNNGELEIITSLFLSIISNITSSLLIFIVKKFTQYYLLFNSMKKDLIIENNYLIGMNNVFLYLKRNIFIFAIISFFLIFISFYYISIFCIMYYNSQLSLIYNYLLGIIESFCISFTSSIIVTILRIIGLKCKMKQIFEISKYIDNKF